LVILGILLARRIVRRGSLTPPERATEGLRGFLRPAVNSLGGVGDLRPTLRPTLYEADCRRPVAHGQAAQRGDGPLVRVPARHLPADLFCQPYQPPGRADFVGLAPAAGAGSDPPGRR